MRLRLSGLILNLPYSVNEECDESEEIIQDAVLIRAQNAVPFVSLVKLGCKQLT